MPRIATRTEGVEAALTYTISTGHEPAPLQGAREGLVEREQRRVILREVVAAARRTLAEAEADYARALEAHDDARDDVDAFFDRPAAERDQRAQRAAFRAKFAAASWTLRAGDAVRAAREELWRAERELRES